MEDLFPSSMELGLERNGNRRQPCPGLAAYNQEVNLNE